MKFSEIGLCFFSAIVWTSFANSNYVQPTSHSSGLVWCRLGYRILNVTLSIAVTSPESRKGCVKVCKRNAGCSVTSFVDNVCTLYPRLSALYAEVGDNSAYYCVVDNDAQEILILDIPVDMTTKADSIIDIANKTPTSTHMSVETAITASESTFIKEITITPEPTTSTPTKSATTPERTTSIPTELATTPDTTTLTLSKATTTTADTTTSTPTETTTTTPETTTTTASTEATTTTPDTTTSTPTETTTTTPETTTTTASTEATTTTPDTTTSTLTETTTTTPQTTTTTTFIEATTTTPTTIASTPTEATTTLTASTTKNVQNPEVVDTTPLIPRKIPLSNYYFFQVKNDTWDASKNKCDTQFNGIYSLAWINSQARYNATYALIKMQNKGTCFWIDLVKEPGISQWTWNKAQTIGDGDFNNFYDSKWLNQVYDSVAVACVSPLHNFTWITNVSSEFATLNRFNCICQAVDPNYSPPGRS